MKNFLIIGKSNGVFIEYERQAVSEPAAKLLAKQLGLKSVKIKQLND